MPRPKKFSMGYGYFNVETGEQVNVHDEILYCNSLPGAKTTATRMVRKDERMSEFIEMVSWNNWTPTIDNYKGKKDYSYAHRISDTINVDAQDGRCHGFVALMWKKEGETDGSPGT